MSKFLHLIKKSYLVLEKDNPFATAEGPSQGGDESIPDAAVNSNLDNDKSQDQNGLDSSELENKLLRDQKDLKTVSVNLINYIKDVLDAKGELVSKEFPELLKLVEELKDLELDEPQNYIQSIIKVIKNSDNSKYFKDSQF